MKKAITALGNQEISLKIKEKCNLEILYQDIQYQEGVIDILEKNKEINLLILNSTIDGELNIYNFINKIKEKNNEIEIIIILEEKNIELENFLNSKRIFDFFYDNKNTINELIKKINEKNIIKNEQEINEEIKLLKELILEKNNKNNQIKKYLVKNIILKINKNIFKKKINKKELIIKEKIKIINIVGTNGIGKSIFLAIFSKIIKNKKILIINFDIYNNSINSIFGIKKNNSEIKNINKNIDLFNASKSFIDENNKFKKNELNNFIKKEESKYELIIIDNGSEKEILRKSNLIIFISGTNLIEIEKSRNELKKYINIWKIKKEKINIVFNKNNLFSINKDILKNIFYEFNILGQIKTNSKYNLLINNNLKIIDKKIKKEYLEIIKKIRL